MIDFRYHLISIIAVMLSLALGILVGSGFIAGRLFEDLEARVDSVSRSNDRLRSLGDELRGQLEERDEFARAVLPHLVDQQLRGEALVVIVFDGTDGAMTSSIEQELEHADAEVHGTLRLSDRFRLEGVADREQLALILRSVLSSGDELRAEMGRAVGVRAAASAAAPSRPAPLPDVARLHAIVDELEDAGFVSASFESEERYIPPGASFVIVGGSNDEPPFPAQEMALPLVTALAEGGAAVLVAEPSASTWDLVSAVRQEPQSADIVATVDSAETIAGRVAVVLALAAADRGDPGHYGTNPGASGLLPPPEGSE